MHRGTGAQGAATDGAAVRQAPKNDSPRGAVCGVPLLTLGVYNPTGRVPWRAPHIRRAPRVGESENVRLRMREEGSVAAEKGREG